MPQASIRFNLQMTSDLNYETMPSSKMDKSGGRGPSWRRTRLSTAKTVAEKKEIFGSHETTRLGKKVVLS
jgi:hypothetical protein